MDCLQQEFEAKQEKLVGWNQSWFQLLRQQSMNQFLEKGLPGRKDEEWRFTPLTKFAEQFFQLSLKPDKDSNHAPALNLKHEGPILYFINGYFSPSLSKGFSSIEGLDVFPLEAMLSQQELGFQHFFTSSLLPFSALNTALMTDGIGIRISSKYQQVDPIELHFFNMDNQISQMNHPRILIQLEETARAVILERHLGPGTDRPCWNNFVTELHLAPYAYLEHCKIQQENSSAFHFSTMQVTQEQQSQLLSHNFSLGGQLARNDIFVRLQEGSSCQLNGLYLCKQRQLTDYHTSIEHSQAHTESRQLYKGILLEHGKAVFNGKILVCPNAQKSKANQSNANLLLSRQATINTKPQLEIFADDVMCSHGATVGALDEDSLFYLLSRGLDQEQARTLLVQAFATEVLEQIEHTGIQSAAELAFASYFPDRSFSEDE